MPTGAGETFSETYSALVINGRTALPTADPTFKLIVHYYGEHVLDHDETDATLLLEQTRTCSKQLTQPACQSLINTITQDEVTSIFYILLLYIQQSIQSFSVPNIAYCFNCYCKDILKIKNETVASY